MHAEQHSRSFHFRLCQQCTALVCKSRAKRLSTVCQREADRATFAMLRLGDRAWKEKVRRPDCRGEGRPPTLQERAKSERFSDSDTGVRRRSQLSVLKPRGFSNRALSARGTGLCG